MPGSPHLSLTFQSAPHGKARPAPDPGALEASLSSPLLSPPLYFAPACFRRKISSPAISSPLDSIRPIDPHRILHFEFARGGASASAVSRELSIRESGRLLVRRAFPWGIGRESRREAAFDSSRRYKRVACSSRLGPRPPPWITAATPTHLHS